MFLDLGSKKSPSNPLFPMSYVQNEVPAELDFVIAALFFFLIYVDDGAGWILDDDLYDKAYRSLRRMSMNTAPLFVRRSVDQRCTSQLRSGRSSTSVIVSPMGKRGCRDRTA